MWSPNSQGTPEFFPEFPPGTQGSLFPRLAALRDPRILFHGLLTGPLTQATGPPMRMQGWESGRPEADIKGGCGGAAAPHVNGGVWGGAGAPPQNN